MQAPWSPGLPEIMIVLVPFAAIGFGIVFMCWRLVKHWKRMEQK